MDNRQVSFIPWDSLEAYAPPRHSKTENHQLLTGAHSQEQVSVVHGRLEPGGEAEPHYHRRSSQFLHILNGECTIETEGTTKTLEQGDSVHIPAGIRHRVVVTSDVPLELINVYHPALNSDDTLH